MPLTPPNPPTLAEHQRYIHDLEALHGWLHQGLVENCFRMGEEVGELFTAVRRVQKVDPDADPEEHARRVAHVGEEIVDVMNYLLAIANRLDIDVAKAFVEKNQRNEGRTWA